MSNLKIRDVRAIVTEPPGALALTLMKAETDEPELYGLGSCLVRFATNRMGSLRRADGTVIRP